MNRRRWLSLVVPALAAFGIAGSGCDPLEPAEPTTVVFVVRHAEKAGEPAGDPVLSEAGEARAVELARVLGSAGVQQIYVTTLQRTRRTAAPLAAASGAPVAALAADQVAALVERVRLEDLGKVVLIVGHSNTVPEIVAGLSGVAVAPIADGEYDHLYEVILPDEGAARVVHLRYGARTP